MKKYLFPIALVVLCLCFGCHRQPSLPPALQQAARLTDVRPDSALHLLRTLADSLTEAPEEVRMYYHLLCIKTADKLYLPPASDSLINQVVAFYEAHPDPSLLPQAYYYQGSTYRDLHNAPRAIECYRAAAAAGQHGADKTLMGKIYGQMASLFAYQGLYLESLEAARQEYAYADTARNFRGMALACRDMARIHHQSGHPGRAVSAYREGYLLALQHRDSFAAYPILSEWGGVYYEQNRPDSARLLLQEVLRHAPLPGAYQMMGALCLQDGQPDSAEYYLQQVFHKGTIYHQVGAYRTLSQVAAYRKDYLQAYQYAQKSNRLQDSLQTITQTEEVAKAYALYDYSLTEQENLRLKEETIRQQSRFTVILCLLLITLTTGSSLYLRIRKKRKEAEEQAQRLLLIQEDRYRHARETLQQQEEEIKVLNERLRSAALQNDALQRAQTEAQKTALELSNRLLHRSLEEQELQVTLFRQSDIYLKFHRTTDSYLLTEADWQTLQDAIDKAYSDFTRRLLVLHPHLSELELRICCLIKTGIPVSQIAQLLNRSTPAITAARTRMYKKLTGKEGKAEQTDRLITEL